MIDRLKKLTLALVNLIVENYIFLLCAFFIFMGLVLLTEDTVRTYRVDDAEVIGRYVMTGLKVIAGSLMIGASLISLAIRTNNKES